MMTANAPEQLEWSGKNGAEERFFCMTAEPGASFEEELHSLMVPGTAIWGRGGR